MNVLNRHKLPHHAAGLGRPGAQRLITITPRLTHKRRRATARVRASTDSIEPQVVCVGEALFDFLADQKGLSREEVKSWTPYPGGAPANVATALARLGVKTAFVSALGTDERGEQLAALLLERGVDTRGLQRCAAPTRDVYVVRTAGGDREFAGFGQPSGDYCDCFVEADKLPLDLIKASKVVVTGTLGLAPPATRAALHASVAAAKAGGATVLIDVNWRPVFWDELGAAKASILEYMALADVVKISDADLEFLYDMKFEEALLNPCTVADKLPNAAGVLVTAGEEGAAYCFRSAKAEHTGFVPVFKIDVTDTTGAGDAFTAGFIYKLLEAGSVAQLAADPGALKAAVVFAAATGALTCKAAGAIAPQPTLDEVVEQFEKSKQWPDFW